MELTGKLESLLGKIEARADAIGSIIALLNGIGTEVQVSGGSLTDYVKRVIDEIKSMYGLMPRPEFNYLGLTGAPGIWIWKYLSGFLEPTNPEASCWSRNMLYSVLVKLAVWIGKELGVSGGTIGRLMNTMDKAADGALLASVIAAAFLPGCPDTSQTVTRTNPQLVNYVYK
jgi:hypothetical protein